MQGIKGTSTETFRKLFGNGLRYEIPRFQRDYSWEAEHWDDLWQDILSLHNGEEFGHYLGYLVLQSEDEKTFKVIDGQQRLTTMSVMIMAALKVLKTTDENHEEKQKNETRFNQLLNSYIGFIDPVSLIPSNKLKLNRNNDDFYQNYIVPLEDFPKRGLNISEKRLMACFEWFFQKIKKQFGTGKQLAQFIDTIVDKLSFTVINVSNELNAYKVFETLNARGVQLSSADLLKNYLFSVVDAEGVHGSELDRLEYHWATLTDKLKSAKIPDFLRVYWNSKHKSTRKKDLFKAIRTNIKSKKEVFELLRNLQQNVDVYIALNNAEDEYWDLQPKMRESLRTLNLFRATQPHSLLLSAKNKLSDGEFEKLLNYLVAIYFRYNIISGLNPNEEDVVFNSIALQIEKNATYEIKDFHAIYPLDNVFETNFTNKEFRYTSRNMKIVKYILASLENHLHKSSINYTDFKLTIEHIIPRNANDGYNNLDNAALSRVQNRLGNMALLSANDNRKAETKKIEEKFSIYANSSFQLTKEIPENYSPEWTEEDIANRQKWLAKQAKTVWKLPISDT